MIFSHIFPIVFSLLVVLLGEAQSINRIKENLASIVFWTLGIQILWTFSGVYQHVDASFVLSNEGVPILKAYLLFCLGLFLVKKIVREGQTKDKAIEYLQSIGLVSLILLLKIPSYSFVLVCLYAVGFSRRKKPQSLWMSSIFACFFVGAFAFMVAARPENGSMIGASYLFVISLICACLWGAKVNTKREVNFEDCFFHLAGFSLIAVNFFLRYQQSFLIHFSISSVNSLFFQALIVAVSLVLLRALLHEKLLFHHFYYWVFLNVFGLYVHSLSIGGVSESSWISWSYCLIIGLLIICLLISYSIKDAKLELNEYLSKIAMRSKATKYGIALGILLTSSFIFPGSFQFYVYHINHIFMAEWNAVEFLSLVSGTLPLLIFCMQMIGLLYLLYKVLPDSSAAQVSIRKKLLTKEGLSLSILIILGLYFTTLYN